MQSSCVIYLPRDQEIFVELNLLTKRATLRKTSLGRKILAETRVWGEECCWIWEGCSDLQSYGQLTHEGKCWRAHRAAYYAVHGSIPDGLWILHKCNIPACVNPDHLYAGTPKENSRDYLEFKERRAEQQLNQL